MAKPVAILHLIGVFDWSYGMAKNVDYCEYEFKIISIIKNGNGRTTASIRFIDYCRALIIYKKQAKLNKILQEMADGYTGNNLSGYLNGRLCEIVEEARKSKYCEN